MKRLSLTPWLPEVARAVGYCRSERKAEAARRNLVHAREARRLRRELRVEVENMDHDQIVNHVQNMNHDQIVNHGAGSAT